MKTQIAIKINEQGKIPTDAVGIIRDYFAKRKNKFVKITLEEKRKLKSHEQLGYWFGLVVPLFSQHTGYSESEIHTILKYKAGLVKTQEIDGQEVKIVQSLADATTMEMMALIDATIKWAEFLNLTIPEANINWKEQQ